MKTIILLLLSVILPAAAYAADSSLDQPHWSLEVKAGNFTPSLSNWAQYYGKRDMPEYAASLAYKLIRQVDIGISGGFLTDKGHAFAPLHGTAAGSVTYDLYPVNVFVLLRGVVSENQWIVPYVGGGYTKMFYHERVEGQGSVKGSANGYHTRGGLQFLLDGLDRSAANSLYMDYGIFHTYLFIEAEKTTAKVKSVSVDIGGTSYLAGLLFEF